MLDIESGEVPFDDCDDPTRPKVEAAIVPQPVAVAQRPERSPENIAWWM